jgi:hypothetical protein
MLEYQQKLLSDRKEVMAMRDTATRENRSVQRLVEALVEIQAQAYEAARLVNQLLVELPRSDSSPAVKRRVT